MSAVRGDAAVDAPRRVTFRPAEPYLLVRDAEVPGQDSTDLEVGEVVAVGTPDGAAVPSPPVAVVVGDLVLYRQEQADSIVVDEEPLWLVQKTAVVGVFE